MCASCCRAPLLTQHSTTRVIIPSYLILGFGEDLNGFLMGGNTVSISWVWYPGNGVGGELEVCEILPITWRIDRLPIIRSTLCSQQKWPIFVRASSREWLMWRDCGENIDGRASGVWTGMDGTGAERWNLEIRGTALDSGVCACSLLFLSFC